MNQDCDTATRRGQPVPGEPLLTMESVREWVGDFELGKGRPYAETAVFGCRCHELSGDLGAFVRGTRPRPYRVSVKTDSVQAEPRTKSVLNAYCSCPVGACGTCKHVAAVLLAYLQDPSRFTEIQQFEETLGSRPQRELVALVGCLLNFAPELKPLLAVPMPGFVRETPSPELFRALTTEVIQGARDHDDFAEADVVTDLSALWELHQEYRSHGNQAEANALIEGVVQALRASGLDRDRLKDALKRVSGCEAICMRLEPDQPAGPVDAPF